MLCQDYIILLRDLIAERSAKQPSVCLTNLPCGCAYPGREIQCEECPDLEACLSYSKSLQTSATKVKKRSTSLKLR